MTGFCNSNIIIAFRVQYSNCPAQFPRGRRVTCCLISKADMDSHSVDYQFEPADFDAFSGELRRFASDSFSRFYYFGVLPVLGVGLALATQSCAIAAVFTVLFMSSGWFVNEWALRSQRRNVYSQENLSFRTRRLHAVLTDEGLRVSSDAAESLYRWSSFRQVFRGSRYVHFELTPLDRVHIPIRAFRDEGHIVEFISKAQSYVKHPAT